MNSIIRLKRFVKTIILLNKETWYWYKKVLFNSSSTVKDKKASLSDLLIHGHVLEKGITMPNRRMGFGYDRVRLIIKLCGMAIKNYSNDSVEVQSTLTDLKQYLDLHKDAGFSLPEDITNGINQLLQYKTSETKKCFEIEKKDYFAKTEDFYGFAHQRHSVRWYSNEPIDDELLIKAIQLAQTSPSACNRQSSKVYVIATKEKKKQVLELQNGNRGFGEYADKVLLIASDLRCWSYNLREMAYIDGGIFTMNLLYALHHYGICACTLNANLKIEQRKKLEKIIGLGASEIPVVFISVGNAPDKFMIAGSQRLNTEDIYQFV